MLNPLDHLNQMLAEMPPGRGPRMPFEVVCGAFYALRRGFSRTLIAKAVGLSQGSISKLANCLTPPRDGSTWRYRRVAEEWRRLGELEFGARYYDNDLDDRIARARMKVPDPADARRPFGPDPHADKYAVYRHGPFDVPIINGDAAQVEIAWMEAGLAHPRASGPLPAGWAFNENGGPFYEDRFRTSSLAYDAAWNNYGHDSPRPKPGRPKTNP